MKLFYAFLLSFCSLTAFSQSRFLPISENTPIRNAGAVLPITAGISYQGYDETQAYFGQGEYEIFLDFVDGVLDKPIIVLDGFDPGDGRDINGLYNSLAFGGDNLADLVRDEGFDIVILNAPQYATGGKDIDGGGDYIQRNAMVLVELIETLNAQKVGEEELVVLGPSMGGLIARYGLSYMEENSLDAETRLYISFDSPHKGANIPISLQYLINYLGQEFGDQQTLDLVDFVLNSPAAKEMLVDHYTAHLLAGDPVEQDPTKLLPAGAVNFREAFQTELDNLGFPQDVRNVAMINGTDLGTTIGTPGMQLVDTTLDLGNFITADVNLHFVPAANQTINVTSFNTFFAGFPTTTYDTNAQSGTIAGVDSAPGGTSNISAALGEGGANNPIIAAFIEALEQDEFSFIPTISALAMETEDDWYATPNLNDSPFVNTHIPDVNESHTMVTAQNIAFALSEILQIPLAVNDNNISEKYILAKNPIDQQIELRLDPSFSYGMVTVRVHSLSGQLVLEETVNNPQQRILINQVLSAGVYVLSIEDADGFNTLKLVIR